MQVFRNWPRHLPPDVEAWVLQLPGRGVRLRERPLTSLTAIIEIIRGEFERFLDRPFAFFGHSMGALLSFEFARCLRDRYGVEPSHLFVSGRVAPHVPDPDSPKHNLPESEFMNELRSINGTPQEVLEHEELMQLMIPTLRADFAVCETHVYQEGRLLSCPLTVLGGRLDTGAGLEQLEPWGELTSGRFALQLFPGDHFFLHDCEKSLLQVLYEELSRPADQRRGNCHTRLSLRG